jgi:tetratricopeptide (TPR) repeat protein
MKKKTLTAALIAAAVLLGCISIIAMSEDEAYLAAMDTYNKKDFDKARPLLQDFFDNYKDSKYRPNVMLKLAELETDFSKAEATYRDIIKDKPDTEFEAEAVFSLGRLYYGRNDYVKCEEEMGVVMGRFGNTVWIEPAYHYLMLSLNAQKKYGDTEKLYADYNSNKNYFMFKNRIKLAYADALYNESKYPDAIIVYRQVIEDGEHEKYIYLPVVYAKIISCFDYTANASEKEKYVYDLKQKFPDSPEAKQGGAIKPAEDALSGPTPSTQTAAAATPAVGEKAAAVEKTKGGKFYTVQIGAYANRKFADYDAGKLKKKGYTVFYKAEGKFTKVMVGKLKTKAEADALAQELTKKGLIKSYLVKQAWE